MSQKNIMETIYKGFVSEHPKVEIKGDMLLLNWKALEVIEWKYSDKKERWYDKITKVLKDWKTYDFILVKKKPESPEWLMVGRS